MNYNLTISWIKIWLLMSSFWISTWLFFDRWLSSSCWCTSSSWNLFDDFLDTLIKIVDKQLGSWWNERSRKTPKDLSKKDLDKTYFVVTQVKDVQQETTGSAVFRRFHESSIPVNGSGDRIYPVSPGTDRNLSKPTAGCGHRILVSNSWHFPAGSGQKREVSWGFSPEIHGILFQESSTWEDSCNHSDKYECFH